MASNNLAFTENHGVVVVLPPDSYAASAQTGEWVSIQGYERVAFIVQLGDTIENPVAIKLQEATDSSGTDAADITDKTGTFTADDDDSAMVIEVGTSELSDGFTHVTVVATPDTAAAELSSVAIQVTPYSLPVANSDLVVNLRETETA